MISSLQERVGLFRPSLATAFPVSDPACAPALLGDLLNLLDRSWREIDDRRFASALEGAVPGLRRFARSLTRDREDAEDLLQEALLKAWAARHRFEAGTNIAAWSSTILRRVFLSSRRRDRFHAEYADVLAERVLARPEDQSTAVELTDTRSAMAQLPANQRQALVLVAVEGLSYEDVAIRTATAIGTVKSRVTRARYALRRALEAVAANDEPIDQPPADQPLPAPPPPPPAPPADLRKRYARARANGETLWIG